jgi:hypothetical protein
MEVFSSHLPKLSGEGGAGCRTVNLESPILDTFPLLYNALIFKTDIQPRVRFFSFLMCGMLGKSNIDTRAYGPWNHWLPMVSLYWMRFSSTPPAYPELRMALLGLWFSGQTEYKWLNLWGRIMTGCRHQYTGVLPWELSAAVSPDRVDYSE